MSQKDNWWARQFVEGVKEIARVYDQFYNTREIEDFDKAYILHEELNEAYKMSWNFLDFIEFGRIWIANQTLPRTQEQCYE